MRRIDSAAPRDTPCPKCQHHVVRRVWGAGGAATANAYGRGSDKVSCCVLGQYKPGHTRLDHADMQQALSLFLDQAGKGGDGQGQGTQQGSVLTPSQLQQRTGNRKTMTGSHPQLHNPHPAGPSSPSQGRNPVCRRNLLVAPDIALLGRGPPHSLTQALRNKSDHSHGAVT